MKQRVAEEARGSKKQKSWDDGKYRLVRKKKRGGSSSLFYVRTTIENDRVPVTAALSANNSASTTGMKSKE